MDKLKYLLALVLFMIPALGSIAQAADPVEMADTMRSNGKIYVVIAVILTILAGLILYLVRIDRRVSRLEKDPS
jgi:uncharacterized membrane protein YqhA